MVNKPAEETTCAPIYTRTTTSGLDHREQVGPQVKVIHAYNLHRSGGGANIATLALIDLLRSRGIEIAVFERSSATLSSSFFGKIQTGLATFNPYKSIDEFCSLLQAFQPDLVHAHELFPIITPWILPECRKRSIPVVLTCNDYHLTCPARNHVRHGKICKECSAGRSLPSVIHNCRGNVAESTTMAAYCSMVSRAGLYRENVSHYIAPSAFAARWLAGELSLPPNSVSAISSLVPIPAESTQPGRGTYAAFAGRFVAEKGIGLLIDAATQTRIPLRLSRHRSSFVDVHVPSAVSVTITDTRKELENFYLNARMVVVPSTWFETFGLVAAEAMAFGIPVIASRIGALEELIDDGMDGILFEAGNSKMLAEKMTSLWENPEWGAELGRRARQKAIRLWSPDQHFERTLTVYQKVLKAKTTDSL